MRDTDVLGAGDPGALEALLVGICGGEGEPTALLEAYRHWGWMAADLDPLNDQPSATPPALDPGRYGLTQTDARTAMAAYCGRIGWEIGHVGDPRRYAWLCNMAESDWMPDPADRQRALDLVAAGELLEATLDKRLPGAKTFGLSGAESFLVLLQSVLDHAAADGTRQVVVGGMHRGRLTQMGLIFGKPLARLVADAKGVPEFPEDLGASSDSPYHLGWHGEAHTINGRIGVWIAPHPSHLSVVAPVAMGYARALADTGERIFPLALHTDAAFSGQGINAEILQLSELAAFSVGGTVHLILDNQIGFTTGDAEARTASTCASSAKVIDAPVLHVNGTDPDAVLRAASVAVAYRQRFAADIVVRLVAVRRKGHNEIDDPSFTQPGMYRKIEALPVLSDQYARTTGYIARTDELKAALNAAFEDAGKALPNDLPEAPGLMPDIETRMRAPVSTGVAIKQLQAIGAKLTHVPEGIDLHPKVMRFLSARSDSLRNGTAIDWATAEALAFASLAEAGANIRFGGQDSVRGAFSQRHFDLHCQKTDKVHSIFQPWQGKVRTHNTPLTESAVLGFEYGHSIAGTTDCLTIWEAQFGDFLNVCQSIFDQFIICGEDRWLFRSNLTLLLPHGVDGGGPDHATAHPERLLAACARGNIRVANCSTPANYFHLLRQQVMAPWRKPLIVLAPKTLLRHPDAKSPLSDFEGEFAPVISEAPRKVRRVVLSTGKLCVLLASERKTRAIEDVALIRLEQLYPLNVQAIRDAVADFGDAELVWAQEEPENMGYFMWLDRKLEAATGRRWHLVSRPASPSASAGPKCWDDAHLARVIDAALEGEPDGFG